MPKKYTRENIYAELKAKGYDDEVSRGIVCHTLDAIATILQEMHSEDRLELRGIGVFRAKIREGRKYHNVRTGKMEYTSPTVMIKFTGSCNAAKDLKEEVYNDEEPSEKPTKLERMKPIPRKAKQVEPEPVKVAELTQDELKIIATMALVECKPIEYLYDIFPEEQHAMVLEKYKIMTSE